MILIRKRNKFLNYIVFNLIYILIIKLNILYKLILFIYILII